MNKEINTWKHLFKLDPAKEITNTALQAICESETDGIIVGGTDHITLENVVQLQKRISGYDIPIILEVSSMDAITLGFDYYFIPMVLNSKDKEWMMDIQHEAIKQYKELLNWDEILVEGYCILNSDAKAFRKTNCILPDEDDITAYAYMVENIFKLPIFYLEYSGTYGNKDIVRKVKQELTNTLLFYGGGITNEEQAAEMKQYADVIIVGNHLYDDLEAALKTVKAVHK